MHLGLLFLGLAITACSRNLTYMLLLVIIYHHALIVSNFLVSLSSFSYSLFQPAHEQDLLSQVMSLVSFDIPSCNCSLALNFKQRNADNIISHHCYFFCLNFFIEIEQVNNFVVDVSYFVWYLEYKDLFDEFDHLFELVFLSVY